MVRIILAGVAGGIVYYVWAMLTWMVLPIHADTFGKLPDESKVTAALVEQNVESGVYTAPFPGEGEDWSDPKSEFAKNHAAGPLYSIYYRKEGEQPMPPSMMLGGLILDVLAATLAACLLSGAAGGCCSGYLHRVGFVLGLGIFATIISHGAYWNWMHFPTSYTLDFVSEVLIGWTLAGLAMAAIVRPPAKKSSDAAKPGKPSPAGD